MQIGRVYKIIHNQSNICYVGSTFDKLRNRFGKHKRNNDTCISKYFKEYGVENFKIILIKEYEVYDKKHLLAYEQLWINKLKSINIMQTFKPLKKQFEANRQKNLDRTEYLKNYFQNNKEKNKEKIKEYRDNYREINKEKINKKIICECGGKYTLRHKSTHLKTKKHLNFNSL
uniref:GIY-YIG domain-containing protein n=1 Tax=viral metagenome TaxID=1070528 RepID=A0A6C0H1U4_9ZZZZ